jgi:D-arabinose 1-dehydrogenase-like Zn-dependent alcohol dehydrogenase
MSYTNIVTMIPTQTKSLPETCKAIVLHEYGQDLRIESIPTPKPVYGAVVVKIEALPVYGPSKRNLASGASIFSYPTPFVPGGTAIARIVAVGPDTTTLEPGQLVLTDYFIRARDNPDGVQFLRGASTMGNPLANKLALDLHHNGTWAEYHLVTHENCHPLDEKRFLGSPADGGLGYKVSQLGTMIFQSICYSGLCDIGLKAGETIVILPATGVFGGCAVEVASAMGARVVAGGRNVGALKKLARTVANVKTVQLTGDVEADTAAITGCYGPVDTYFDISAPAMPNTNHISSGIASLTTYGRACMMGGQRTNIPINYGICVLKSLTIKGRFMYEREHVQDLIKLAATGALKLGSSEISEFKLEDWKEALDVAEDTHGWGKVVSFSPFLGLRDKELVESNI